MRVVSVFVWILITSPFAFAASEVDWRSIELSIYKAPGAALNSMAQINVNGLSDRDKASYFAYSAIAHQHLSDAETAQVRLTSAAQLLDAADDYTRSVILVQQAYAKELAGDVDAALSGYLSALRVANNSNSVDSQLLALVHLINHYSVYEPSMESALSYAERAAQLANSGTRMEIVASLHAVLGNIHSYLSDYEFAEQQYRIAERLYTETNNQVGLSNVLYNLASLFETMEDYQAAIRAYEQYTQSAIAWGDPTALFFGNMGLASVYDWLGRPEQALMAINQARLAIDSVQDATYLFEYWLLAAYISMSAADVDVEQEAFERLSEIVPIASGGEDGWVSSAYLSVSIQRAVLNEDFETAFDLSESLRLLQVGLLEAEKAVLSGESRTNSDSSLFQQEAQRLSATNQQQEALLLTSQRYQIVLTALLVLVVVAAVMLFFALQRQIKQRRILQQFSAIWSHSKTSGQRVMENVAGLLFEQAQKKNAPMSVIVFDLKNIAQLREKYDDLAAERVHQWFQSVLHKEMRTEDKLGQVSFNRYLLVLPNATARVAKRFVEHVSAVISEQELPQLVGEKLVLVAGVTERGQHDDHSLSLTNRAATAADMALDTDEGPIKVMPA